MLNNTKELYSFLDKLFIPNGFYRKKDTYYYSNEECICFFTIVKSSLGGGRYDHVMGCFLKELMINKEDFPKYYTNHLKFSLRHIANKKLVQQVFDFENHSYKNNEREKIIETLIEKKAIPFLKDISTKQGITKAVVKYKDLIHYMKGDLQSHLNIQ